MLMLRVSMAWHPMSRMTFIGKQSATSAQIGVTLLLQLLHGVPAPADLLQYKLEAQE